MDLAIDGFSATQRTRMALVDDEKEQCGNLADVTAAVYLDRPQAASPKRKRTRTEFRWAMLANEIFIQLQRSFREYECKQKALGRALVRN